jgi:hypothetical protein
VLTKLPYPFFHDGLLEGVVPKCALTTPTRPSGDHPLERRSPKTTPINGRVCRVVALSFAEQCSNDDCMDGCALVSWVRSERCLWSRGPLVGFSSAAWLQPQNHYWQSALESTQSTMLATRPALLVQRGPRPVDKCSSASWNPIYLTQPAILPRVPGRSSGRLPSSSPSSIQHWVLYDAGSPACADSLLRMVLESNITVEDSSLPTCTVRDSSGSCP